MPSASSPFSVAGGQGRVEQALDLLLERAVEHRGRNLGAGVGAHRSLGDASSPLRGTIDLPALLRNPSEVSLEHLAEVHATGDTERVEDDVDRGSVGEERHVLDRQDLRDDALVAVTTGELVARGDLALLGDVHHDALVDTRAELVIVVSGELLDRDDRALFTVRNLE